MSLQGGENEKLPMGRSAALSLPGMVSLLSMDVQAEDVPQAVRNAASLLPLSPTLALLPHVVRRNN